MGSAVEREGEGGGGVGGGRVVDEMWWEATGRLQKRGRSAP